MDETVHLSSSEKAKIQNEKQIYCLLRLMNYVEKFYSTDKIDQTTYRTQINKLLQKYNKFSQIIPGYSLPQFERKYNIPHEQISWAKYVIEKGVEGDQGKQTFLFMQATATFIEVNDTLGFQVNGKTIGDIKMPLQKLQLILKKIYQKLGPEFNMKFNNFNKLMDVFIINRSVNQIPTQSQFKELKLSIDGMYTTMGLSVQK